MKLKRENEYRQCFGEILPWRGAENVDRRAEMFIYLFSGKRLISRWGYITALLCAEANKSRGIYCYSKNQ